MIFVNDIEKKRRLSICKACKYYKEETKTCGTFRAIKPKGDTITYRKKKVSLCGCIMPLKTKFKGVSCPINKWKGTISKEDTKLIKEVLKEIEGKQAVTAENSKTLLDVYNKAFGTNKKYTSCSNCRRSIVEELKNSIYE